MGSTISNVVIQDDPTFAWMNQVHTLSVAKVLAHKPFDLRGYLGINPDEVDERVRALLATMTPDELADMEHVGCDPCCPQSDEEKKQVLANFWKDVARIVHAWDKMKHRVINIRAWVGERPMFNSSFGEKLFLACLYTKSPSFQARQVSAYDVLTPFLL